MAFRRVIFTSDSKLDTVKQDIENCEEGGCLAGAKPEFVSRRAKARGRRQLGTLGAGNHFIEFQKGSDGFIWIMIHSGSRNLGKQVAEYYQQLGYDELVNICGIREELIKKLNP